MSARHATVNVMGSIVSARKSAGPTPHKWGPRFNAVFVGLPIFRSQAEQSSISRAMRR